MRYPEKPSQIPPSTGFALDSVHLSLQSLISEPSTHRAPVTPGMGQQEEPGVSGGHRVSQDGAFSPQPGACTLPSPSAPAHRWHPLCTSAPLTWGRSWFPALAGPGASPPPPRCFSGDLLQLCKWTFQGTRQSPALSVPCSLHSQLLEVGFVTGRCQLLKNMEVDRCGSEAGCWARTLRPRPATSPSSAVSETPATRQDVTVWL